MLCLLKKPDCHVIHPECVLFGRMMYVDFCFSLSLPLVKPHSDQIGESFIGWI